MLHELCRQLEAQFPHVPRFRWEHQHDDNQRTQVVTITTDGDRATARIALAEGSIVRMSNDQIFDYLLGSFSAQFRGHFGTPQFGSEGPLARALRERLERRPEQSGPLTAAEWNVAQGLAADFAMYREAERRMAIPVELTRSVRAPRAELRQPPQWVSRGTDHVMDANAMMQHLARLGAPWRPNDPLPTTIQPQPVPPAEPKKVDVTPAKRRILL